MASGNSASVRRGRKLPARFNAVVTPLVITFLMTCIVSGISTLNSIGLRDDFAATWLQSWGASWVVAFPTLVIILPLVRRIVGAVVEPPRR